MERSDIMGYFPFFINIKDKKCVIVGGGNVAARKVEKLLPFEPDITVIAPEISDIIKNNKGIKTVSREFRNDDINDAFFVISASDDEQLNAHIFKLCSEKKILVNTVDDCDKCGFIFPAVVHKNDITIGISTAGKSPIFASYLRMQTEKIIDKKSLETVELLGKFRNKIKQEITSESVRKKVFENILKMCTEREVLPDDLQIYNMIEEIKKDYEN